MQAGIRLRLCIFSCAKQVILWNMPSLHSFCSEDSGAARKPCSSPGFSMQALYHWGIAQWMNICRRSSLQGQVRSTTGLSIPRELHARSQFFHGRIKGESDSGLHSCVVYSLFNAFNSEKRITANQLSEFFRINLIIENRSYERGIIGMT